MFVSRNIYFIIFSYIVRPKCLKNNWEKNWRVHVRADTADVRAQAATADVRARACTDSADGRARACAGTADVRAQAARADVRARAPRASRHLKITWLIHFCWNNLFLSYENFYLIILIIKKEKKKRLRGRRASGVHCMKIFASPQNHMINSFLLK